MELDLLNKLDYLVAICNRKTLTPSYSTTKFNAIIGEYGEAILTLFDRKYKSFSRPQVLDIDGDSPYSFEIQLKDGSKHKTIEVTISDYNEDNLMIVGKDITELKKLESSLRAYSSMMEKQEKSLIKMAYTDSLTGIANRRAMFKIFNEYTQNKNNIKGAICILDIDHFKQFNDIYGHDFGDYVLKYFAEKITLELGDDCYFARIGGEEFCVFSDTHNGSELNALIDTVLNSIKNCDIPTPNQDIAKISFSAGICEYTKNGTTLDELLSNADKALYAAKATGRCRVISFSTALFEKREKNLATKFREAER